MKQRFSSLDVKVIAHELSHTLSSLRLANIYDLSSRIFLLKFAKSDQREQLVVDSGFRCHLTSFSRTTAAAPSAFVARLRKYLRTRRVTKVAQVGTDRIIDFQFSDGQYHLFLEFYAAGNIILTDGELKILALLRIVSEGSDHEQLRVGASYSLSGRQNVTGIPALSRERLVEGLQRALTQDQADSSASKQKGKRKPGDAVKKALASKFAEFPPVLIEHVLMLANVDTSFPVQQYIEDAGQVQKLLEALHSAKEIVEGITRSEAATGYIIAKPKRADQAGSSQEAATESEENKPTGNLLYEDFHPFEPKKFVDDPSVTILRFEGFNKTVDEYFSSIEGQKLESRLQDRQDTANRKLETARKDHANRLTGLQDVQQLNVRKAQAIEANIHKVEEVMGVVNGMIAQGMDWVEIARLIELEQTRLNPLAQMIKLPLKLYENTVTLLLSEWQDEEDDINDQTDSEVSESDDESQPKRAEKQRKDEQLSVDIDLSLSPWGNAREYYDQKRNAAQKEQKTLQQSSKALKNTERKINADLAKGLKQEKELLRPVRKQFWFEKFLFFISSEGYLVLGGRDAQQNEILYKRYFKRGDVYVHAELEGAISIFIKNNPATPEAPIPPSTLSQAGTLSVATSHAWDSKAVMSAWWVGSDQVSKAAPTGDYLPLGQFATRGKKNFLPPAQLVLGFGVLFQISDESKARHVKHRAQDEEGEVPDGKHVPSSIEDSIPREASEHEAPDEEPDDIQSNSSEGDEDRQLDADQSDDPDTDPGADASQAPESSGALVSDQQIGHGVNFDDGVEDGKAQPEQRRVKFVEESKDADVRKGIHPEASAEEVQFPPSQAPEDEPEAPEDASSDESTNENPASEEEKRVEDEHKSGTGGGTKPKPARNVRGKRGKQKKIASKYRDQDEEDRVIAMKILGSAAGQAKAEEEAKAQKAREEAREIEKRRRREQHLRAAKEGLEQEEARRRRDLQKQGGGTPGEGQQHDGHGDVAREEDDDDVEEQQAAMEILSNLVGTPLPDDDILAAIPVCAPWSTMSKYKYKAKLQPGSQKKGKAIKEILGKWLQYLERHQATSTSTSTSTGLSVNTTPGTGDQTTTPTSATSNTTKPNQHHRTNAMVDEKALDPEKMWPKELELIKAWRETELFSTVPVGKVRVMITSFAGNAGGGGAGGGKGAAGGGKKGTPGGTGGGAGGGGKRKARGGKGSKKDRR